MFSDRADVLVTGAGPVGLFAALRLARAGVRVQVIDADFREASHSYALALHPSSVRLLADVDLLEPALKLGRIVRNVAFCDAAGAERARVALDEVGSGHPFALVLPQSEFETLLRHALEQQGVRVKWNRRLSDAQPEARGLVAKIERLDQVSRGYAFAHAGWAVEGVRKLHAQYVIGADGHRSIVRRLCEIDFPEVAPTQYFAVFEFETDCVAQETLRVVLGERNMNVLWPLPEGVCRWSFELEDPPAQSTREKSRLAVQVGSLAFPALDRELLMKLLRERAPWFDGAVREPRWSMAVRFEKRLAGRFGNGRMWLAGDAAHLTGPVGVHSMNAGLWEAQQLAHALTRVVQDGDSPALLEEYGADARARWLALAGPDAAPAATERTDPWVRANRARILASLPASGDDLVALLRSLDLAPAAPRGG